MNVQHELAMASWRELMRRFHARCWDEVVAQGNFFLMYAHAVSPEVWQ